MFICATVNNETTLEDMEASLGYGKSQRWTDALYFKLNLV